MRGGVNPPCNSCTVPQHGDLTGPRLGCSLAGVEEERLAKKGLAEVLRYSTRHGRAKACAALGVQDTNQIKRWARAGRVPKARIGDALDLPNRRVEVVKVLA